MLIQEITWRIGRAYGPPASIGRRCDLSLRDEAANAMSHIYYSCPALPIRMNHVY